MPDENGTERAILEQVQHNNELLKKIYVSTEKTRKMFLWTLVITVIAFILPLIGLALAIPSLISMYSSIVTELQTGF